MECEMLPDFNRLRVFYHIYKQKSSTDAANALHITQSGVSQHLKKLEEELQTTLFTRVNRRLVPTAAGHTMFTIVEGFISQLEQGIQTFNTSAEKPSGCIKIGAPAEFGRTYMPQIFAAFYREYPEVSLQLDLGDPNALFTKVASGDLDFAYIDILPIFFTAPGGLTAYEVQPVLNEELVLACSKTYYDTKIKNISYEKLITLNYIGYKTDISLFCSWFSMQFHREPSTLDMAMVVDSAGAIISGMEENMGLAVIVSHLISRQLAEGSLVSIKTRPEKLQNTIACVRFRNKKQTKTESVFQEFFQRQASKISNIFLPSV